MQHGSTVDTLARKGDSNEGNLMGELQSFILRHCQWACISTLLPHPSHSVLNSVILVGGTEAKFRSVHPLFGVDLVDSLHCKLARNKRIALVPNFIVGNSVISGVMGSFFLFSGYFISKHGIPNYWIFMQFIWLFKYPFEGFLINEFPKSGKCLEHMLGSYLVTGEAVLRE
ncbi:hypothetical protein V6N13_126708 [Hibiscus sabdariffa]|uniref:ABC-2 type transporter transmembrane domain-containing protein n=1 Tax=Hibiscus sabdariffa TaxID=183260 RepID=A0ABR2REX9_9ROSI